MVYRVTNRDSYGLLHGALIWGILTSLLQLLYPALKLRDQFVAAVYLMDHLASPGVGVGKLVL